MSELPPSGDDPRDDVAAEYVLGLLEGAARAEAAERMRRDPAFRAEVEAWEQRLAPLLDQVSPIEAPAGVWDRITASIQPGANVVALPARRERIWRQVGAWRAATAVSAAAAAAFLAIIVLRPSPALAPTTPRQGAVLAATLSTSAGKPLFVATIDRSGADVAIVPVGTVEGQGRYPELWIIAGVGKPKPVGMIQDRRPRSLALADARPSDVLAVSLEPEGGSPTGAPTGPVIATGALRGL